MTFPGFFQVESQICTFDDGASYVQLKLDYLPLRDQLCKPWTRAQFQALV